MVNRYPSCLLATCCIPWDEHGMFMERLFRDQVRIILSRGTAHVYVFGTAGEGYAVSDRQFEEIVGVFHEVMHDARAEPMVGVISLSLPSVIERIERAGEIGVSDFQISLPSWGAVNDDELFEFFGQTCGRFPQYRFLHYNLPRARRLVTPSEYARLADAFPNLVATKNSTDSIRFIDELLTAAPSLRHFLTEAGYSHGSLISECGLLGSVSTINWEGARQYFEAGQRRDADTLTRMQRELNALTRDLIALVGTAAHMDGAYDKMFCRLHDRRFPLRLLPPYQGVSDECFERFALLLRQKYPACMPVEFLPRG